MNKKTLISLLLCLVLGASLFAFPAFADGTTVVLGSTVDPNSVSSVSVYDTAQSAVVVSGGSSEIVSNGSVSSQPASSQSSAAAVVVMANGSAQPVQQTVSQTQTAAVQTQQIQTSSSQTAAASNPVVIPGQNTTAQTAVSDEAPNELAKNIFNLLNETRAANGLPALRYSSALQASADTRATESVQNFSHLRPDGSGCETAVTVDYMVTGENLIQVTSEFATAAVMMDTWMNSPTHRNNILLSSFTDVAVGIYVVNGTTYVSTVFVGY